MKSKLPFGLAVLAAVCLASLRLAQAAVAPSADEMARARQWMAVHFEEGTAKEAPSPFFSFTYDGEPSDKLLPTWRITRAVQRLDDHRTQRTLAFSDPKTKLIVRCVGVEYRDYPTVEWTVHFKNPGRNHTPILKNIEALDTQFKRGGAGEFVLHHGVGSPCRPDDYRPLQTVLQPNATKRITAAGGRPTNSDLSYFNLAWPGQGAIVVVGWPGQWAAEFVRDDTAGIRVVAGQELTNFKLHPGEEVRTPLIVLQFHDGNVVRAQNIWRRWMIAHNVPRPGGKPFATEFDSTSGDLSDAAREIRLLEDWGKRGIQLDHWIMDANWYPNGGKWFHTGTWEPDPARFPRGLREVNEAAHAHGIKTVVWFEPERVWPGSWLWEKHQDWLLKCPKEDEQTPELGRFANRLLDLGNPRARQWLVNHIDQMITKHKIDVYRQDFNINPLAYWRANDLPDRQGITENRYVTGYLAWWDELLRRHPEIWIDTCASGGRRNDLETLRRAAPLCRSDFFNTPEAQQCQTFGISFWMPFYGTGSGPADDYMIRSSMCPLFRIGVGRPMSDAEAKRFQRHAEQFRRIAPLLTGDFYPLTDYALAKDAWVAWQFDRPDLGQGVVQAFRRSECAADTVRLKLHGLDADNVCELTNFDAPGIAEMTGKALADDGLPVVIKDKPGAAIVAYKKKS
jgi:alpha-galactosidase